MRLPNAAHEARPWVIRRIAPDFRLLDVWALPVTGDRDDFDRALAVILRSFDPSRAGVAVRGLVAARVALGRVFRWDDRSKERPIPGARETSLRERLPEELRGSADPAAMGDGLRDLGEFTPLYRTGDEWAAEISNETVHGVLHVAWAEHGDGRHRAQLAVYVKTRGRTGAVYLRLIEPFRHLVVYPALIRQIGRLWEAETRGGSAPP